MYVYENEKNYKTPNAHHTIPSTAARKHTHTLKKKS